MLFGSDGNVTLQRHWWSRNKCIIFLDVRSSLNVTTRWKTRGYVGALYNSGLPIKTSYMRGNYTRFEHSNYYVTKCCVTFGANEVSGRIFVRLSAVVPSSCNQP